MTTFPAGVFDDWNPASVDNSCFENAWDNCNALTEQSIENILLSISASGVHATTDGTATGTAITGKEITIGAYNTNVDVNNLSPAIRAACTALQSRGWEVVINNALVSEYALSFNGTDEYIDLGTSSTLNPADITVAMWIKPNALTDWDYLFTRGQADYVEAYRFEVGATHLYCAFGDGSSNNSITFAHGMSIGKWHHFAVTYDGATAALYVDGVSLGTKSISIVMEQATRTTTIGQPLTGAGNYFDGEIDEVGLWNVALDADAIADVYNSGAPINLLENDGNYDNKGDLVSWWRMGDNDSGAGDVVTDAVNPTVGADLITNGAFAADTNWSKGTGWSISSGTATSDNSQTGVSSLRQSLSLVQGALYEITYDWSVASVGTVLPALGSDVANGGVYLSAVGTGLVTYVHYTGATGAANFDFYTGADSDGSVDNITVKQLGGNAGLLVNSPTYVVDNPPNYSNYSVDFVGDDDYVVVGDSNDLSFGDASTDSPFSVSAWINMDDATDFTVIGKGVFNATIEWRFGTFGTGADKLRLVLGDFGGSSAYIGRMYDTAISSYEGEWIHVAGTYNGGGESSDIKVYLNGIQVDDADYATGSYTAMENGSADVHIGQYSGTYSNGKIDEVAIFSSELTSAQVNDIYNGGVPASLTSLSPVGWWRLGENNAGTGVTITDQGSGTNNGTLTNGPTFSRSVPAEDATWNNRSLAFTASSSEHMTTTADDTLATKSYSFWAKSSDTADNGVFSHGTGAAEGAFVFNGSVGKPILYLASDYYRYWADNSAQDDGAWHHHVVYLEHDDITNCKWYVDGVVQTTDYTVSSGSADAYTAGILLGKRASGYFDGNLDEFAIFDGELTPAQVLQIYNGGKPADLKEFSPESWWRMGDDDDAGGTTIRDLGVVSGTNLVTNGTFQADTDWTKGTGWTISGGTASNDGSGAPSDLYQNAGLALNYDSYTVTYTVSNYSSGSVRVVVGGSSGGAYRSANGTYTEQITVVNGPNLYFTSHSFVGSIDNVSVTKDNLVSNGGFDADTVWTKDSSWSISGGTATNDGSQASNTKIEQSIQAVQGALYEVTYDWDTSDHNIAFYIGGDQTGWLSSAVTGGTAYVRYTGTTGAADFKIYTSSNSTGSVDNVSLRQVDGNPATLVNSPTFSTDIP